MDFTPDDLPLSKSKRLGILAKSALRLASKHSSHRASKALGLSSKEDSLHLTEVAQEAFKTLTRLRGTALKAAQLLSQETPFRSLVGDQPIPISTRSYRTTHLGFFCDPFHSKWGIPCRS